MKFFALPGDGPVLLGMPTIEVLGILKIIFEATRDYIKAGCSTPEQCRHPIGLVAKQTKFNRSRQTIHM